MAKPVFEAKNLQKTCKVKRRDDVHALDDVNLVAYKNEFVCMVRPPGCGKATLLDVVAGLEFYDSGSVTVHGQPVIGSGPNRTVVFQQYALFPWMAVKKNIEFAMKFLVHDVEVEKKNVQTGTVKRVIKSVKYACEEKRKLVEHYIKMVDLEGFEDVLPSRLPGGMKQRVALARSYVTNANMLLMDEPFNALDAQTRAQLQEDSLRTQARKQKTYLFITHDMEEAVLLATKVMIMGARPGRIKTVIDIDLPYPRTQAVKMENEFIRYRGKVWEQVYREYLEVKK